MHGIIFIELMKMVERFFGQLAWNAVLRDAGLESKIYMPMGHYPDSDAGEIISAIAMRADEDVKTVMEDFGEFIVPDLMSLYRPIIQPEWGLLELLENTDRVIHRALRRRSSGAFPPALRVVRTGEEVLITYSSARPMCGISIGVIRGLSKHYSEPIALEELTCMLHGADACRIAVRRASPHLVN
jgi:predicted hydrocarbon binding protein